VFRATCVQGTTLMFKQKDSDDVDTWITDSWPGWGGTAEKCAAAAKSLKSWGKDILVVSTIGGKIGFPGVDKWGFLETPHKSCYEWKASGAPEESLKDLKQVTLDELIEKGQPK
jgi:hypothetical protein